MGRILLLFLLFQVNAANADQNCRLVAFQLRALAKRQSSLNFDSYASPTDRYQIADFLKPDRFGGRPPVISSIHKSAILMYPESKEVRAYDRLGELGKFEYVIHPDTPHQLYVEWLEVRPRGRRGGLTEAMFARILNANPGITEVRTEFSDVNRTVARKRLRAGLDCETALIGTPAGQMRMRFGFTKVIEAKCDPKGNRGMGSYSLILGR